MIELKGVRKSYGANEVLKGIDLRIEEQDYLVILGASGSGKSTLLNILSGLEKPDQGEVLYDGENIASLSESQLTKFRKNQVAFIFQQYYLLQELTVEQNVKMGAHLAKNKDYLPIIDAMGLKEKLHQYPSELSGGEQQRIAIARALAKKPKVLFLDELAEFKTNTIEVLRQPMENKTVSIARVNASIDYPADFMLVRIKNLIANLVVYPENMMKNLLPKKFLKIMLKIS